MTPARFAILHDVYRAMEVEPDGRGVLEPHLRAKLGVNALDLYYLTNAGLLVRRKRYLKLSAAGMDIVEHGS
ncbi:MAG: hypothetical protein VB131_01480 [Burkholderia gladioli]